MGLLEYSSSVVLTLLIEGVEIALSHVGSKSVVFREPVEMIPPTTAKLIVAVDGIEEEKSIYLPEGIPEGSCKVAYF